MLEMACMASRCDVFFVWNVMDANMIPHLRVQYSNGHHFGPESTRKSATWPIHTYNII